VPEQSEKEVDRPRDQERSDAAPGARQERIDRNACQKGVEDVESVFHQRERVGQGELEPVTPAEAGKHGPERWRTRHGLEGYRARHRANHPSRHQEYSAPWPAA
jgi:hypothetical protein